jgi:hypothetical protein
MYIWYIDMISSDDCSSDEFTKMVVVNIIIIIIIIIHTPYYLRHAVLLLSLSYRKPSNGENYTLRYYYALTASTSYNCRSLINLFILI